MPVIHQHSNQMVVEGSCHHKIKRAVTIYIFGGEQQSTEWRCQSNGGTSAHAELQVNRISSSLLRIRINLNRSQVWLVVSIKIADGKMR